MYAIRSYYEIGEATAMYHLGHRLTAAKPLDAPDSAVGVEEGDLTVTAAGDLQQFMGKGFAQRLFVSGLADIDGA